MQFRVLAVRVFSHLVFDCLMIGELLAGNAVVGCVVDHKLSYFSHVFAQNIIYAGGIQLVHNDGLGFACKPNKDIPFIGRDAYLARKAENKGPFLCFLRLRDPDPLPHHNEPLLRNRKVAGFVTSAACGYTVGSAVGLCCVDLPKGTTEKTALADGEYTVMVEGVAISATLSLAPFHDPKGKRMFSDKADGRHS